MIVLRLLLLSDWLLSTGRTKVMRQSDHTTSNLALEIKVPYCFNAILRIVFGMNSLPPI